MKNLYNNIWKIFIFSFLFYIILAFFWETIKWITLSITENEIIVDLIWKIYLSIYGIDTLVLLISLIIFVYKKLNK